MKHTILIILVIFSFLVFAQPQSINFQGVVRNAQVLPLLNHSISLRPSILDSSSTGQSVYVETNTTTTSNSGLFNTSIGSGTVLSGTCAKVPW